MVHDELVELETQGLFVGHGRNDILTTTIGKPKHSRRVRGVGGFIGLRDYFGPPQRINASLSQEAMRKMEQEMEEKMNQRMGIMEQCFIEQLQQQQQIQRTLEEKYSIHAAVEYGDPNSSSYRTSCEHKRLMLCCRSY